MKIDEAKSILLSYRATGADASDPTFAEALALTQRDPALRAWFERQQAFDRGMNTEVEAMAVPAGLRDTILAAAKTGAHASPAGSLSQDRGWWRDMSGWGLGLAAGIAVMAALGVAFWPKPKIAASDSTLAAFAIVDAQDASKHGGHGEEAKALNKTLNTPTTHLGDALPANFASLRDTGCRTVHVEGRDVVEMCFRRNGVQFHCYIARREDFPALSAPAKPVVTDKNGSGVATWADPSNLYIVISKPGRGPLEKLL